METATKGRVEDSKYSSVSDKHIQGKGSQELTLDVGIDATLIRLGLVLLACTGAGIIAYFVAAIIVPDHPQI